ncbi:hypothetical protein KPLM21_290052 [Klebsiella pneumoniae]|nr:hypothetical protein KPLM21_290052 [Klebsiella pneumoniae]
MQHFAYKKQCEFNLKSFIGECKEEHDDSEINNRG